MDIKVTGPEDYEEQGIKPPRSRNLLPSKKYRESCKEMGRTNRAQKKAIKKHDPEDDSFSSQVDRYKRQLQERKKTREILNNCGLKQGWLSNKTGRTELESRVLKRMLLKEGLRSPSKR
ncbi:hypothetical protein OS493_028326 [Desmophyllum pertusum]|uniref:Uncharacterized protein n=1 Tax=Desmophyllum pertusum TaxID=174260 RepID=A0A9W9YCK6_9CNID|nr:hypothetical protein OS493_028326 [Desmophyllum pertusum]